MKFIPCVLKTWYVWRWCDFETLNVILCHNAIFDVYTKFKNFFFPLIFTPAILEKYNYFQFPCLKFKLQIALAIFSRIFAVLTVAITHTKLEWQNKPFLSFPSIMLHFFVGGTENRLNVWHFIFKAFT